MSCIGSIIGKLKSKIFAASIIRGNMNGICGRWLQYIELNTLNSIEHITREYCWPTVWVTRMLCAVTLLLCLLFYFIKIQKEYTSKLTRVYIINTGNLFVKYLIACNITALLPFDKKRVSLESI